MLPGAVARQHCTARRRWRHWPGNGPIGASRQEPVKLGLESGSVYVRLVEGKVDENYLFGKEGDGVDCGRWRPPV